MRFVEGGEARFPMSVQTGENGAAMESSAN
jgi:hypothetical protein